MSHLSMMNVCIVNDASCGPPIATKLWWNSPWMAVKCLHTFEIQNTANVVAMDETAIYDYSSVRICLNANIPTKSTLIVWCFVSNKHYFIEQKRGEKQYVIFLVLKFSKRGSTNRVFVIRAYIDFQIPYNLDHFFQFSITFNNSFLPF
jgi:hypothetical protein